ncbi:spore gernimation protein GerC [Clostridium carboxidivorans P7]|uniref:Germination protein, Ger(X)C family n=1 Tax=Clostridium carboxidivorans P7 TaxID=536227 RepID=C6PXZ2_9CLOT|nr:Ger(x)C family spore germination protein [Clostridium carboxidivorans]AKN31212.1 spore gernimation protein GerC [Clostridium carboxidivorans P7]EET85875.1 germination protein, Ger(x)C family [Clostridium carboxidivorans P7]EFG88328.1 germination protein, Ger(X)C family [Clostridium carboxidivorans P7]
MKYIVKLMLILIFSLSLTSCDFKDIDRRTFVVALGIDSGEQQKQMKVIIKTAIPTSIGGRSGGNENQKNYQLFTVETDSIGDALRKFKAESSLEPDFSHLKIIIFGKNFAQETPIDPIIDYFIRRRDLQTIAWTTVGFPSAKKILELQPPSEKIASNSLFLKFGQGVKSQYIQRVKVYETYRDLITPGLSPCCPIIEIVDNEFSINKIAVFEQGKMKMVLSPEETRIFNIIKPHIKTFFFKMEHEKNSHPIGFNIKNAKTDIRLIKNKDNSIDCQVNVKLVGAVEETDYKENNLFELHKQLEVLAKGQIEALFNKFKQSRVDPFSIQARYWAIDPSYEFTEDWLKKIFSKINFIVNVDAKINESGSLR